MEWFGGRWNVCGFVISLFIAVVYVVFDSVNH